MGWITASLAAAAHLVLSLDPILYSIPGLSLAVSLCSVALATIFGGAAIAVTHFPGRRALVVPLHATMGLLEDAWRGYEEHLRPLGVRPARAALPPPRDTRFSLLTVLPTSLGRVASEAGAVMIIGFSHKTQRHFASAHSQAVGDCVRSARNAASMHQLQIAQPNVEPTR
jgi:ABC-type tungstate transport system substrate-binding protein